MKPSKRAKSLPKVSAVFQTESTSGSQSNLDEWVVFEFHIREAISFPYQGYVEVVTERTDVDYSSLVGKSCALVLSRGPKQKRTFTGIIFRVKIINQSAGQSIVRFDMAAAFYALQYGKRSRVFENMSAAEIIVAVILQGIKPFQREVEARLLKEYPPRECCTQFQESDSDFVLRLMAEEGMFFYFDHSGKTEKLVLVDSNDACPVLTPQKAPAPKVVAPLPPPRLDKVILRVVENESSEPIPGVKIKIKLLSGIVETLTTNQEGIAEKQVEPATYRVYSTYAGKHCDQYVEFVGEGESPIATDDAQEASPESPSSASKSKPNLGQWPSELVICKVEKHRVKTGDTLVSLAASCAMTTSELAYYNWGTWDKDQIEMFMRTKVGCTKQDQQGKYCFDDSDNPGIIYCPQDWELDDIPRNKMHTLRVRKVERGLGDVSLYCEIKDLADAKDDSIILEATDGSWKQGINIADMPEVHKDWVQLQFRDVPSGKSFNLMHDYNDGGDPEVFEEDISYAELLEWARAEEEEFLRIKDTPEDAPGDAPELNEENEEEDKEESSASEQENTEAAKDQGDDPSPASVSPAPEENQKIADERIAVTIEPIASDFPGEENKQFAQSLTREITEEVERSSVIRLPKRENGEAIEQGVWMLMGGIFIDKGVVRTSTRLADVATGEFHGVSIKEPASIGPQQIAKKMVKIMESYVQGK